ncbi:MAG: universal stress protein [Vicinamibacterales bacterium]|nr:universal stress protein [Vicinamibacterales bacterium]
MRWRSITCSVDFSECSREALQFAEDLAHRTGGRLSVVYVNGPGSPTHYVLTRAAAPVMVLPG